ncbi:MAG: hypothetical protein CMF31_09080 [Kordiimonas sp.]|nr:hypothetical protein [Kordiimonas sp.]
MSQEQDLNKTDVEKLLLDPTPENRAKAAEKVSLQFSRGSLTDKERALAEDIFKVMVQDAEVRVRQALSQSLKDNPEVPHDVAIALASDVDDVSLPMLEFSEVLTDDDLVELIATQHPEQQKAIARRENVSSTVADAIIENSEDEDVVATLVSNESAHLTEGTMDKVLDKFGESEKVNAPLAERGQLPVTIAERLVTLVSEKVRDHLVTHHEMSSDMAMDLFLSARERATVSLLSDGSDALDVQGLIEQLHSNGRLTSTLIFRALCMGDMTFFEAALAKLAGIPNANAYQLIHDRGQLGMEALFEKCGLPKNMIAIARAAISVAKDMVVNGMEERERFRHCMIERVLTQFEDGFDPDNLDYFIAKLGGNSTKTAA